MRGCVRKHVRVCDALRRAVACLPVCLCVRECWCWCETLCVGVPEPVITTHLQYRTHTYPTHLPALTHDSSPSSLRPHPCLFVPQACHCGSSSWTLPPATPTTSTACRATPRGMRRITSSRANEGERRMSTTVSLSAMASTRQYQTPCTLLLQVERMRTRRTVEQQLQRWRVHYSTRLLLPENQKTTGTATNRVISGDKKRCGENYKYAYHEK